MAAFQGPGRSAVHAANGMAATSHPLAARVAVRMLEDGGNAVDAAIAGAVLLGVCEPHMTGLGGDMFAIVKPAGSERLLGLNASGRAPAGLDAATLRAAGLGAMPRDTGVAAVVPGAVAGFALLAETHGRKGLDAALAPAIRYFEEGVPVAPRVAHDWADSVGALKGAGRTHFLANGAAPRVGDRFAAPGQAEVLRRVAREGPQAFYEGEVAEDIAATLRSHGGAHEVADFAACRADWVEPLSGGYRGARLWELPPNGHGATALLALGMLERFGAGALDPVGADRVHLEMEISKLAYAARNQAIADPDHMRMSVADFTSAALAEDLAGRIDLARAQAMPRNPIGAPHRETIYITVVDRDRTAVSLIYSIFDDFGCGIASEKFGVLLNNRAAGFVLEENHPNEAKGGKRPLHTIIPAMLEEPGGMLLSFGVMGGPYQVAGHLRLVSNLVDHGMELQAAIDAPRSFYEEGDFSGTLMLEAGYPDWVVDALTAKGHRVGRPGTGIGGAQAIRIDGARGVLSGASDPRKDGCALGY